MILEKDKSEVYCNLAYQFGIHPDRKIILNRKYREYFYDLLSEILCRYKILEVKDLDDGVLYTEEILYRGL